MLLPRLWSVEQSCTQLGGGGHLHEDWQTPGNYLDLGLRIAHSHTLLLWAQHWKEGRETWCFQGGKSRLSGVFQIVQNALTSVLLLNEKQAASTGKKPQRQPLSASQSCYTISIL